MVHGMVVPMVDQLVDKKDDNLVVPLVVSLVELKAEKMGVGLVVMLVVGMAALKVL